MSSRQNRRSALMAAATMATLMVSGVATAAIDMFLKVDGIKGESADPSHKGEIDVLAWSWGLSSPCTVQDLALTKFVDAASPPLLVKAVAGAHIAIAKLTVRRPGDPSPGYIVLDLTDVQVASVSTGGTVGEDRLTENITLKFASLKVTYTPPFSNGAPGTPQIANINVIQGCVPR